MKKLYPLLLFSFYLNLLSNQVLAQTGPAWAWAVNNNILGAGYATGLVTDTIGNVYTAGFNLSKHDASGALVWSKALNAAQYVRINGLANDADGNLYLAGLFGGTIQFDTVTLTSYGHTDIFVAKYNSNGEVQWARNAGGPGPPPNFPPSPGQLYDAAWSIAADAAGNCYITGICEPNAQFDTISATSTTIKFVAKYDTQGNIQWVRAVPSEALGIALGPQNSYYLTGGGSGVFCEKYNADGSLAWKKQSAGSGYNYGKSAATDALGNCYMTGVTDVPLTFDNFTVTPPGNSTNSMFLVKFDSTGSTQWARHTTGNNCGGVAVATDSQGNAYVTGGMTGTVNFSPTVQLSGINNGKQDVYAAKYNAGGNLEWAIWAGGGGSDHGQAIGALPNGDVYVTGSHQNGCAFGNISLSGPNSSNFFVAKISATPLGIPKTSATATFQLYPNPATSEVNVSPEGFRFGTFTVFSLTGQKVYEGAVKPEMKINIANWPAGIYAVKLTSGSKTITRKLVVAH